MGRSVLSQMSPHPDFKAAVVLKATLNYNLKACILRPKTHGFAGQYAAFCEAKPCILQNKAMFDARQNKS